MYPKYLKTIGINTLLDDYKKKEADYQKTKDELLKVVIRMCEAEDITSYNISNYNDVQMKLKELCGKMVDREYKNTEDGKELLALDQAHQQAQDMIWSAGSQSETLMKMISATLQKGAGIDIGYKPLQIEANNE
tara:strand:- start:2407 stop:2808 length:402 start_codon:yes stop_codon:yes gene_type:complete